VAASANFLGRVLLGSPLSTVGSVHLGEPFLESLQRFIKQRRLLAAARVGAVEIGGILGLGPAGLGAGEVTPFVAHCPRAADRGFQLLCIEVADLAGGALQHEVELSLGANLASLSNTDGHVCAP
jgi:hypothetical protein